MSSTEFAHLWFTCEMCSTTPVHFTSETPKMQPADGCLVPPTKNPEIVPK